MGRLSPNRGDRCLSGLVVRFHRMERPPVGFTWDPDWTFDVVPRGSTLEHPSPLICTDADYVRCFGWPPVVAAAVPTAGGGVGVGAAAVEFPQPTIHCEIPSAIARLGCVGGTYGAGVGAVAGIALAQGLAGGCVAFGFWAPLCLLIVLIIASLVTWAFSEIGAEIGHAIGRKLDEAAGMDETYTIDCGTCVTVRGDWVLDQDHGWNEIHDVEEWLMTSRPPPGKRFLSTDECVEGCPTGGFVVAVEPEVRAIGVGGSAHYTVSIVPLGGFSDPVELSVPSGLPGEAQHVFLVQGPVIPPANVGLTINTTAAVELGEYVFPVLGQSGSQHSVDVARMLVIEPAG